MNQVELHVCVNELAAEIAAHPAERKSRKDGAIELSPKAKGRSFKESLDHLRLSIKYLLFDLEATRRENECLRNMIRQAQETEREHDDYDGETV